MRTMPDRLDTPESAVPPEREILVAAAVIRRGARFLVAKRPAHKRHGGLWEFPGGKLAPGESLADGVRREVREELGLDVIGTGAVLFDARDPGSPFLVRFVEVQVADRPPHPTEHDAINWLEPAEILTLPLAPSDGRFVREWLITDDPRARPRRSEPPSPW